MKACIDLKMKGLKSELPIWKPNKSYCVVFIDNNVSNETRDDCILVDAFSGDGANCRRRKRSMIRIDKHNTTVFEGTFDELCNKLSV